MAIKLKTANKYKRHSANDTDESVSISIELFKLQLNRSGEYRFLNDLTGEQEVISLEEIVEEFLNSDGLEQLLIERCTLSLSSQSNISAQAKWKEQEFNKRLDAFLHTTVAVSAWAEHGFHVRRDEIVC